jgi:hypothetical protein
MPVGNNHHVACANPFFEILSVVLLNLVRQIEYRGILVKFVRTNLSYDSVDTTLHFLGALTAWTSSQKNETVHVGVTRKNYPSFQISHLSFLALISEVTRPS